MYMLNSSFCKYECDVYMKERCKTAGMGQGEVVNSRVGGVLKGIGIKGDVRG